MTLLSSCFLICDSAVSTFLCDSPSCYCIPVGLKLRAHTEEGIDTNCIIQCLKAHTLKAQLSHWSLKQLAVTELHSFRGSDALCTTMCVSLQGTKHYSAVVQSKDGCQTMHWSGTHVPASNSGKLDRLSESIKPLRTYCILYSV